MSEDEIENAEDQNDQSATEEMTDEEIWNELEAEEAGEDTAAPDQEDDLDDQSEEIKTPEDDQKDTENTSNGEADDDQDDDAEPDDGEDNDVNDQLSQKDHIISSLKGQQRRQDQRIRELEAQLAQKPKATPGREDTDQDVDAEGDDPLADLDDEYPEVAGPIRKMIEEQKRTIADLKSQVSNLGQTAKEREQRDFLSIHEDGFDVISSNPEIFQSWINNQQGEILQGFERNRNEIADAASAAKVVTAFKSFLGEKTPNTGGGKESTSKIENRRKRQLQSSEAPSRGSSQKGRIPGPPPDDAAPETWWDYLETEEKKKSAR